MNILLINHYAGSPELGMEFRPYYMAKEWIRQGHKVLIVGATYSHLRKKQPLKEGRESINGVDYYWIKTNEYKGNGIGRIYSMFLFVFKLFFRYGKLWREFQPDVVIASSTYPLDIYPAHRIAERYKAKLVYEVHDLWPLSPREIGGYSQWHPFIMIMQAAENSAYKYCDLVVSLLPNALKHMEEHGLKKGKFIYIPNGFDSQEWERQVGISEAYRTFFEELRSQGKKILGYAGGHALSNALDYLLDAMKLIQNQDIVCVLIGKGQEKERLRARIKEENINNVYFLDAISKLEIPDLLKQMDVLYIGWENNPLYRFGISPNKLIDYMMAGKPILHSVNAANDWVFDCKCGVSVSAESPSEIAEGIECIFSFDRISMDEMGKRGKVFVQKELDYAILSKKILAKF